jgi:hypothetical protein
MFLLDSLEVLFVIWAFLFQVILIIHFALRKWRFNIAMRFGPIVYALSIPAAALSLLLLLGGKTWSLWIGGFIYLVWGIYGYSIEYVQKIQWRNPVRWAIFVPYVFLHLGTVMFYWWPLALISRPLWYVYAILFIISVWLNATSHKGPGDESQSTKKYGLFISRGE